MRSFFTDVVTAARLTREIHRSKKDGAELTITAVKKYPFYTQGYWYNTIEGCLLSKDTVLNKAVKEVFDTFDEKTRHALTFSPAKGKWVDRAQFWKKELKPVLPKKQYTAAMLLILDLYIRCINRKINKIPERKIS